MVVFFNIEKAYAMVWKGITLDKMEITGTTFNLIFFFNLIDMVRSRWEQHYLLGIIQNTELLRAV